MKKKTVIGIVLAAVLLLIVVAAVFAVPKIKAYLPYYYDKTGKHQEDKPYTLTMKTKWRFGWWRMALSVLLRVFSAI